MSKTKTILVSIGGVTLACALTLAYFTIDAVSARGESDEECAFLESEASRLARLKVYPGPEAVRAVDENRRAYEAWNEYALALASAGDRRIEETTPASFKAFIGDEAKRLSALPGCAGGRFVKADFGFGFDEYVNKGNLPAAADLPRLQREWYDVGVFIGLLVDAGASSIAELSLVREEPAKEAAPAKRGKGKRPAADNPSKPDVTRFNIVFTAGSGALVKVMNGIAANSRFVVAEDFSFARKPDVLAERLGEKSEKRAEGSRRRRRIESQPEEAAAAGETRTGVVTDPASATDFTVAMKVAVYDFRTKAKAAAAGEEQK